MSTTLSIVWLVLESLLQVSSTASKVSPASSIEAHFSKLHSTSDHLDPSVLTARSLRTTVINLFNVTNGINGSQLEPMSILQHSTSSQSTSPLWLTVLQTTLMPQQSTASNNSLLFKTDLPDSFFTMEDRLATSGEAPYPDLTQLPLVQITFVILYAVVMATALAGNLLVAYTVLSNRKMQTVVNCYIVNLALCDFLISIFVLPSKLLELLAPAEWSALNNTMCTGMLFLQTVVVFASVLTLVATCFER